MTEGRVDRYRQLFVQIGEGPARALMDRLQVLALTQPDAMREFEALIGGLRTQRVPAFPNPNRRRNSDRRKVSVVTAYERRSAVRRSVDRPVLASGE